MGWNPVERSPDIPVVPNTFQGNQASWYGGAISVRNADLEIWAGEALVANGAVRDGGALFVGGTIAYANRATAPFQSDASYRSSANLPAARGARLHVSGTDDEPVLFDGNHAESSGASHGGALFLYQEPLTPVDYPTPPITAGNFSVGLLRSVLVRGAHFVANRSDEDESGLVGSTITTLGLNHRWRQDYPGPDFVSALNDILAGEPLGPYDLQQLDIELDRGIGIYVLNSEAPDIDLRLPPHSAIRQSAGNPEGQGWGPTILNNSATRSVDP
jgi:hypothetical protein